MHTLGDQTIMEHRIYTKIMFTRLIILISISFLTSCTSPVQHADPFYNVNDDFSIDHIPLIKPIEVNRRNSSSPWDIELHPSMWVNFPGSQGLHYLYAHVHEPKFAVKDGVIMAYSSYVYKKADPYIQNNYYHWFVMVLSKNITKGFQTEDEFRQYIQTLGIQDPDWQTPDEAFDLFLKTGCLDWFTDCQ